MFISQKSASTFAKSHIFFVDKHRKHEGTSYFKSMKLKTQVFQEPAYLLAESRFTLYA